jgi:hypothetical protein
VSIVRHSLALRDLVSLSEESLDRAAMFRQHGITTGATGNAASKTGANRRGITLPIQKNDDQ